jgi:hypothetical protein
MCWEVSSQVVGTSTLREVWICEFLSLRVGRKWEEGELGKFQRLGGCAEFDGIVALGCQRIMWAVHTESTNNTEVGPVEEVLVRGADM